MDKWKRHIINARNIFLNQIFAEDSKVEFDLSNFATKVDLKKETGIDTSEFAKKTDLASLKSDVGGLGIEKLKTVTVDLSKLSNVLD